MVNITFKKMLFDIACATVACDGHIDDREVRELRFIDESTTYFGDIDLSGQLEHFLQNVKMHPEETINNVVLQLGKMPLSPVEELLVLEVALRIVYADIKIDPEEIKFLKLIRSFLSIDDEIIRQRFGENEILLNVDKFDNDASVTHNTTSRKNNIDNIENAYFDLGDEEKS